MNYRLHYQMCILTFSYYFSRNLPSTLKIGPLSHQPPPPTTIHLPPNLIPPAPSPSEPHPNSSPNPSPYLPHLPTLEETPSHILIYLTFSDKVALEPTDSRASNGYVQMQAENAWTGGHLRTTLTNPNKSFLFSGTFSAAVVSKIQGA